MKTRSERKKIKRISQSVGDQIERIKSFNRISMDLAAILDDFIKSNEKMTQKKLAEIFGKKESEISKWLSGKHNFTIKSIALIEEKLGSQLFYSKFDHPKSYLDANLNSNFDSLIESIAKFVVVENIMKLPEKVVLVPRGNTIWKSSTSLCLSSDPKSHRPLRHKDITPNPLCLPIDRAFVDEKELYQGILN